MHERKLAVMKRCSAIVLDAQAEVTTEKGRTYKFKYVSIQALSNHLRDFCVEEGLDIVIDQLLPDDKPPMLTIALINAEEPKDRITTYWPIVQGDKGFAYSVKYPLMRLFLIGDGEENDEAEMSAKPPTLREAKRNDPQRVVEGETPNERLERIRKEARERSGTAQPEPA